MSKPQKAKRVVRSFEINERANEVLKVAIAATGMTQTELMNEAINRYMGQLVKVLAKERKKAFTRFEKLWGENGKKA